jgi:D-alanyl-D-alanine carboxypeptidase (penicillin-binding protein 5/6)
MRKLTIFLAALLLLLQVSYVQAIEPPVVTARAAILLDQATGRILFSKNAHEQLPMASTTKIMTAIIALESAKLDDVVTVSEYAAHVEGSAVDLEAGEEKTMEELVYGLILRSGNDAATAIAEHMSGSVEKFAERMTNRARELGATQTRFMNPHGLHHEEHYTTAYDFALISAHAMLIPKFHEISTTREKKISWPGREYERLLRNQNKLLTLYPGADGIKTGWTTPSGRCFVGSATRDGWQLISVVLNAPQMWEDTTRLLDFGYEHYRWQKVVEKDQPLKTAAVKKGVVDRITLVAGESAGMPLKENEQELLKYSFVMQEPLTAPLKAGQRVGMLHIYFGQTVVKEVPLLACETVEKRGLGLIFRRFFSWLPFVQ